MSRRLQVLAMAYAYLLSEGYSVGAATLGAAGIEAVTSLPLVAAEQATEHAQAWIDEHEHLDTHGLIDEATRAVEDAYNVRVDHTDKTFAPASAPSSANDTVQRVAPVRVLGYVLYPAAMATLYEGKAVAFR